MISLKIRAGGAVLVLASLLTIAGCGGGGGYGGGGGGGSPPSGTITMITISPATMTIAVNGTQQYTTVAKDSNGNTVTGANFTWTSSSPAVATVNSSGLATAKMAGTTKITASITYSGGIYGVGVTYTSNAATLTISASGMAVGNVAVGTAAANTMVMMTDGATGHAVQAATVSLKDSSGQTVVAMSDASGRFQLATSGLNGGFLLKATDNQGRSLFSFADGGGVINITPLTDLMVRTWYRGHGTTADAAFADPAAHPVPNTMQLTALNKAVTGLLAGALTREGLDANKYNLITTPFTVNGTGFSAILDNVVVVTQANGQILLRDMLGHLETTISFDAPHNTVMFGTTDADRSMLPRTSLVLQ